MKKIINELDEYFTEKYKSSDFQYWDGATDALDILEQRIDEFDVVIKTVKAGGNSGRVYVPVDWIGRRVEIRLLDENKKSILE